MDNVKLWFAKNNDDQVITINEVSEENKNNTYSCPMCGSKLIPKAIKSKQVTSHFAHVDVSKCGESMIHWWFKHKFLEKGDRFIVKSDIEEHYICKDVLVEKEYTVEDKTYKPDVTVITECGNIIYFEMAFSNKKKVKDYLDIWLELKNIVVEVDIKDLMSKGEISTFKALFYEGECHNVKKNDTYYNTIGKYKEEKLKGEVGKELKERIQKLDWFWDDVLRYRNGEVDIEYMSNLINSFNGEVKIIIDNILSKQNCSKLVSDLNNYYLEIKNKEKLEKFNKTKEILENNLNEFIFEINKKQSPSIVVSYFFDDNMYLNLSIKSNLMSGAHIEILSKQSSLYFIFGDLEYTINKIRECVNIHINSELTKEKIERTKNNLNLKEAISMLNKKYSEIDSNYEIVFEYPYLILNYNGHKCIKNNFIKEIDKYSESDDLFRIFDNKIRSYRSKLKIINNKQEILEMLTDIEEDFKFLRDKMYSIRSYKYIKIYYYFASEDKLYIKVKNETRWKDETIIIKNGIMIVSDNMSSHKYDIAIDIEDTENLKKLIKEKIQFSSDEFNITCNKCKRIIGVTQNELLLYIKDKKSLIEHDMASYFKDKCEDCKLLDKNMSLAKKIKRQIDDYFNKVNLNFVFDVEIGYDSTECFIGLDCKMTYYYFNIDNNYINFISESGICNEITMEYFDRSLFSHDNFIINNLKIIEEEYKSMKNIKKHASKFKNCNIKLIDNSCIIPTSYRFKYFKNTKCLDIDFIRTELLTHIEKFKDNKTILFMFNSHHIKDLAFEIDKLKEYGLSVSILENCTKK